jgi:hypothetical protein
MCNDFSGVATGGNGGQVIFDQGHFPLVGNMKVYANKMGGSQNIYLTAAYWNSLADHSFANGTKARVAIVGNSYSGNPITLEATFSNPNFTGIDLFKLDLTTTTGITSNDGTISAGAAPLFSDPTIWWLY